MKAEIKEEELMIGNKLQYRDAENSRILTVATTDLILFETNEYYKSLHSGIPLTPEILEKCGLGWEHLGYSVIQCKIGELKLQSFCGYGWVLSCNGIELQMVKYLHQLQNLYFALTGTHLTIEL